MPSREIDSKNEYKLTIPIQEITTDITLKGNGIDLQSANSVQFTVQSGIVTDGSFAFTLDESDVSNFAQFNTVADSDLRGAVAADLIFNNTLSDKTKDVGYVGNKRFVRWSFTSIGVTLGGFFSGTAILSHLNLAPATN